MSAFGPTRPKYLRTYGKHKRKVEQWFSPDVRKKAFSSTSLSEQSIVETTSFKKRKKKIKASDAARRTHKAATALKKLESDEENVSIPDTEYRNKVSTRPVKNVAKRKPGVLSVQSSENEETSQLKMRTRKKKPQVLQSTIDEDDSNAFTSSDHKKKRGSIAQPFLRRFVTHRRRAQPIQAAKQSSKQSFGVPDCTLDSSEEFTCAVPPLPRCLTKRKPAAVPKEFVQENSDRKPSVALHKNGRTHSSTVLREVSFNDSVEEKFSCKHPQLCSTPSLVSRQNLLYLEPSVIEISSFSCDELYNPPEVNSINNEFIKPQQFIMRPSSKRYSGRIQEIQTAKRAEESVESRRTEERSNMDEGRTDEEERSGEDDQRKQACEGQTSGSIGFVSAQTHLDSRVEQLKERCRSVSAVVLVEEMDVVDFLFKPSCGNKPKEHETCSPCLETECSNSFSSAPSSSMSIPSRSTLAASNSIQTLEDRLKVECLSSCLTVDLQALDRNLLCRFRQAPLESPKAQATSPLSPEIESDEKRTPRSGNTDRLNPLVSLSSGSEGQAMGLVRRLSDVFKLPAVSPAPTEAPSKSHMLVVPKEPSGAGTARKASVRGLSVSRWSKRDTAEQRKKHRKKSEIRTRTKPEDCSLNYLLPARTNAHAGESVCGWLPGNSGFGLPMTPLRVEQLNLSSILANFTPDTLTTHNWGRLKAALSVHKKKTAFPTPQRLAQSNINSPRVMDTSMELFGTPLVSHTPLSRLVSSRLHYSSMTNASTGHEDEDISDAEKVYQECQQNGPLSFDDCIPKEQMKRCTKIGEGTFGEVFSTINSSGQTVALKIIPVEGSQKVNDEPQKTFGEILHEIIISKELSSLDSKNNNQTSGFIGLNNLHCVRGCYPSALLKCWDKFDREKGSENDRPDFFSDEQFFVILEFEFGGSDLENMQGKLSSMVQARSILHQVTAALAVAEQALCFEHRDLHWGNILVKTTKEKENGFTLNGSVYSVETRGVHVNIIDYSLSRLEIDGLTVSCDIANDEELFMGHGDYQFEIYRLMKKENNNCWGEYNPHSNVLWLHYLVDKLLTMKYKSKAQSSQQRAIKSCLKSFHSEILHYRSATDALLHCSLFQ